jgi:hypothetical protein
MNLPNGSADLAQVRHDNALALFDEFVERTVKHADAATLRGLEKRFAEQLLIQPSYWSQIKSRSRQIGERLARQFEQRSRKPVFWMDQPHDPSAGLALQIKDLPSSAPAPVAASEPPPAVPQDDDERFILGLVLTYYRRHPQRARARLLDLLGEVLTPIDATLPPTAPARTPAKADQHLGLKKPAEPEGSLWQQAQAGVAPLKRKK